MIREWRALVLIVIFAFGCRAKDDKAVARLQAIKGTVEKSLAPDAAWRDASVGDKFILDSAVRTGEGSTARLVVGRGGGILDVEPSSVVRFGKHAGEQKPGEPKADVRVEAGAALIESGDERVAIGTAQLEPGGRARVSANEEGLTISVAVGQVVLESGEAVTAGNSITVKIGGAIVEEVGTPVPKDAAVVADAVAEPPKIVAAAGTKIIVAGKPARHRARAGWQVLPVGEHELEDGTRIDAPAGSKVTITREGAHVRFGGGTEVRLTAADNPAMIELLRGGVRVEADSGKASAALVGGSVVLEAGEISATMVKDGTELEARRGDAIIRSTVAEEKLQEGDTATLDAKGKITFQNRAPTRVVFSFPAGESLTIHDATAPTPVRVRWGGCPGGRLEVSKDARFSRIFARAGGVSGGNALLPVGNYAYRVRCEKGRVVRGSIKVLRDSGRKPLPKAAPRTLVEPDGREYVISYQNLLPALTFTWRDAPAGRASYTFVIQPTSGEAKRIKATSPRVSLKSGELGEGSYKFWVEIPETGGRSDEARFIIDFDNAAATASIEKVVPKDGGKVQVRGTVIEGTTVTAGETPVPLDRHQRFDAELASREGEQGVAIRIAHRKLGVHYYVLRSSK